MKVSKTAYGVIFNLLVATFMSTVMSLVMALVNVGPVDGFFRIWFPSFLISEVVAIPATFIAIPLVGKILHFLKVES